MDLSEIIVKRHPGCLFSDVSQKFPDILFFSCLDGYDEAYYEVKTALLYRGQRLATPDELVPVIGEITQHPLFENIQTVTIPDLKAPIYSIKVHDQGYTEGVLRMVLTCKGAELPQFQRLLANKGVEKYHVVFYTPEARKNLERILQLKIGKNNVEIRNLQTDASREDIINKVPSFFDIFIPEDLRGLLKRAMIAYSSRSPEFESSKNKVIEIVTNKYPWLIKHVLKVLRDVFKCPLGPIDC